MPELIALLLGLLILFTPPTSAPFYVGLVGSVVYIVVLACVGVRFAVNMVGSTNEEGKRDE